MFQAQTLYDFDGDTDNGELSFRNGETLTIVQQVRLDIWPCSRKN